MPGDDLTAACVPIAADGTDPGLVGELLAWAVRPRRGLEALRRVAGEAPHDPERGVAWLRSRVQTQIDDQDRAAARVVAQRWAGLACRVAVVGDAAYPVRLAEGWPSMSAPLWWVCRGEAAADLPHLAVVGARGATPYGRSVAAWLAEAVGDAGGRVVSGGAVGIDAAAHRAALATAGGTTVVLGCGHGVGYPRQHARSGGLFDGVLEQGGALAGELLPDEPPRPGAVRARNRIVAGAADVVVVVEGGARSGSLLTASAAAERGRTVLAVPGDVRAPGSVAPHRLLAEGAHPCSSPRDVLDALGLNGVPAPRPDGVSPEPDVLPVAVHTVLAAHWPRPVTVDDLAQASGLAVASLLAAVTRGELAGLLATDALGVRLRRRPAADGDEQAT